MSALRHDTFFETLCDCVTFLERCRLNDSITKEDMRVGIEERVCVMMKKMLATPTTTSFCVFRTPGPEMAAE